MEAEEKEPVNDEAVLQPAVSHLNLLLVFSCHVIKPKNHKHSINKVTNERYGRL